MEEIALMMERGDDVNIQWVYLVDTAEELVKTVAVDDTAMAIRKKFIDAAKYKKATLGTINNSYYNQVMDLVSSINHENRDGHFLSRLHIKALTACKNVISSSASSSTSTEINNLYNNLPVSNKEQQQKREKERSKEALMTPIYSRELKSDEEKPEILPLFYQTSLDFINSLGVDDCDILKPPNPLVDEPYIPDIDPCFQTMTIIAQVQRKKIRKDKKISLLPSNVQTSAQELGIDAEFVKPDLKGSQPYKLNGPSPTDSPQKGQRGRNTKKKPEKYIIMLFVLIV